MVSQLSIIFIILNMLIGILIPVGLMIYIHKKYHVAKRVWFIGAGVMFVFALILEQFVHSIILNSAAGLVILGNVAYMAIYGALMAALFEEGGRYLIMKYVLNKRHDDKNTALMYGAGHGGFEMLVILTVGMINNLLYSLMINTNQIDALMTQLDPVNQAAMANAVQTLIHTPSYLFLLSPVERVAALIAQISMSVIVWKAVVDKNIKYFFIAFFNHYALDFISSAASGVGLPIVIIEIIVWIFALGLASYAKNIYKTLK